ncbi:MAG TPA: HAMP domain-containing sensor histidine kinase [Pirellulaceae bacterium]|jgi:signal transduction histidine kinase|nr:HAMP domain-containing sensor histidine kinase [Pirellulaceae bacterium]
MTPEDAGAAIASRSESIAVLAPLGRDAAVIAKTLAGAGVESVVAQDAGEFVVAARDAGAALLTEEALTPTAAAEIGSLLREQPSWSDLPTLLLLASAERIAPEAARAANALRAAGNVTVLVRPIPAVALVTSVHAALRARRRQYEVRNLIEQERTARAQAEAATLLKDEFLATVTHELRTPLAVILLWTRLLSNRDAADEETREALEAIQVSAKAQSSLIDDLIDVARLNAGKERLNLQEMDPRHIARQAAEVVRPMAEAKGIALEAAIDEEAGALLADADRLQQVVWNLLSNAIKFTPAGGRVTLAVRRVKSDVEIRVADTGVGIAPEFLPHVFDRFRQAEGTMNRAFGGLGLGLAIVKQLVELHGGAAAAESDGLGRGACFVVRLPIARRSTPS